MNSDILRTPKGGGFFPFVSQEKGKLPQDFHASQSAPEEYGLVLALFSHRRSFTVVPTPYSSGLIVLSTCPHSRKTTVYPQSVGDRKSISEI
jgi:hypothetical protein